jgi:integrase
LTGVRRSELERLRSADVDLVERALHVRESKTEEGGRVIALTPALVVELVAHLGRTPYKGAGVRVFCSAAAASSPLMRWQRTCATRASDTVRRPGRARSR